MEDETISLCKYTGLGRAEFEDIRQCEVDTSVQKPEPLRSGIVVMNGGMTPTFHADSCSIRKCALRHFRLISDETL